MNSYIRLAFMILSIWLVGCMSNTTNVQDNLSEPKEMQLIEEYCYIGLPDGSKLLLRYSTIDDVIKSLGEPSEKQYSERGNDIFNWDDYWTYTYGNMDLLIHFDSKSRKVIGILSKVPGLMGSILPFGLNKESTEQAAHVSVMSCPAISDVYVLEEALGFQFAEKEIVGMVGFNENFVSWFSLSYRTPWKGYPEE